MRKLVTIAALAFVTALPTLASAQVFVGVRAAYALPWGDVMTTWPMKDSFKSQVPLTLDLGLKLGPALAVGAYASYAFVQPSSSWKADCNLTGSTCSAADVRVGAQVNLHAVNNEASEFWFGVGAGYEQLRAKDSKGLVADVTFKGYDATLQGGIDFLASPTFRVGPFASVTVGQFTKVAAVTEASITNKEMHGWFQFGLRGMFAN